MSRITNSSGELLAVVTRNRYGAEILSTESMMIADVDLPARASPRRRLRRIFAAAEDPAESPEAISLARIALFVERNPQRPTVVYRTAAGLRVIVAGEQVAPGSALARTLLTELGTDPVYLRLCAAHGTYRARLTPKPWRLNPPLPAPSVHWPYGSDPAQRQHGSWLTQYGPRSASHAVYLRIACYGVAATGDQQLVLRVHDQATHAADTRLPLA